jgi:hypothetical protein
MLQDHQYPKVSILYILMVTKGAQIRTGGPLTEDWGRNPPGLGNGVTVLRYILIVNKL